MYEVDLSGKLAVVSGGGRGIGRHLSEALALSGATVAILGRSASSLKSAVEEIGESCHAYPCDLRDPESIDAAVESISLDHGLPDILVNNAAVTTGGKSVSEMPLEMWRDTLDTNLTGPFLLTRAFLPGMMNRGSGDIVMIGSSSGKKGDPGYAAYAASKFGLRGLAQSLFYEVRQSGVRVSMLSPSNVSKDEDVGATEGEGVHTHAADLAATLIHILGLPGRTVVPDIDLWSTNP